MRKRYFTCVSIWAIDDDVDIGISACSFLVWCGHKDVVGFFEKENNKLIIVIVNNKNYW